METPRSRIKGMLRQIFLRSRERANALKDKGYCCERCGIKQSVKKNNVVKLNVHHKKGIDIWDEVIEIIRKNILCEVKDLEVLCIKCHKEEHKKK